VHNERVALSTATILRRGFGKHCPVCGQGNLFRNWLRMQPVCPRCGFHFQRVPGHWLGSWFLNICVAQTVVVLILIIGVASTYPDPPMLVITILTVIGALVAPVLFFPFSRPIWGALDLAMRPLEFDDGVAPGYELADEVDQVRREDDEPGASAA
jgi:uncharacterized protein (DUF983 family)